MSRPRFSIIPADAVTDRRIEPRDLQILCLLGRHTDNRGWCCRSQVKMAKELTIGRATVKRSIDRLVSAGYLEHRPKKRESGGDAAHDYRVIIDVAENTDSLKMPVQEVPIDGQGVPIYGQGVPTLDGQGVPIHERAPMLTTPAKRKKRESARANGLEEFETARAEWPSGFADSREDALEAWDALSAEDQAEAAAEIGRFITAARAIGRKHLCAFGTYLAERRWQALPTRPSAAGKATGTSAATAAPSKPVKAKPTAFQLAHPELYPELFPDRQGTDRKAVKA